MFSEIMKVLITMRGFFPEKKYGWPPVSVENFCSLIKDFDCDIVIKGHDLHEKRRYDSINDDWNDRTNCKLKYLKDLDYKKNEKGFLCRHFRKIEILHKISDHIGCMSETNVQNILKHNPEIDSEKVEVCPNCIEILTKASMN